MGETKVSLLTILATVAWSVGIVGIGFGFCFGPNVGHLGIMVCLVGNALSVWSLCQVHHDREQEIFEIGRDFERGQSVGGPRAP